MVRGNTSFGAATRGGTGHLTRRWHMAGRLTGPLSLVHLLYAHRRVT
jgi:hypothetical protein